MGLAPRAHPPCRSPPAHCSLRRRTQTWAPSLNSQDSSATSRQRVADFSTSHSSQAKRRHYSVRRARKAWQCRPEASLPNHSQRPSRPVSAPSACSGHRLPPLLAAPASSEHRRSKPPCLACPATKVSLIRVPRHPAVQTRSSQLRCSWASPSPIRTSKWLLACQASKQVSKICR